MKTIRIELTPEQNEQMKGIRAILSWAYHQSSALKNNVLELTITDRPTCEACGQLIENADYMEEGGDGKQANG